MPKEKNYKWKLGLFAVAMLALAVASIYYIGKQKNKFGSVLHINALFNSVSGLKIGSNVRFGGIDVGTVNRINPVTDSLRTGTNDHTERGAKIHKERRKSQHRFRRADGR